MGDAEDLVRCGEFFHLGSNLGSDLSTDIGVDLVEDQHGNAVLRGEGGLQGEHNPRNLAAGCDRTKWALGLARIRCEEKIHLLNAKRRRLLKILENDGKSSFRKSQVGQVRLHQI